MLRAAQNGCNWILATGFPQAVDSVCSKVVDDLWGLWISCGKLVGAFANPL
jgi:hypothetical protein